MAKGRRFVGIDMDAQDLELTVGTSSASPFSARPWSAATACRPGR
jgi:hypothetical protein